MHLKVQKLTKHIECNLAKKSDSRLSYESRTLPILSNVSKVSNLINKFLNHLIKVRNVYRH